MEVSCQSCQVSCLQRSLLGNTFQTVLGYEDSGAAERWLLGQVLRYIGWHSDLEILLTEVGWLLFMHTSHFVFVYIRSLILQHEGGCWLGNLELTGYQGPESVLTGVVCTAKTPLIASYHRGVSAAEWESLNDDWKSTTGFNLCMSCKHQRTTRAHFFLILPNLFGFTQTVQLFALRKNINPALWNTPPLCCQNLT